jgi:signal transduction histidine kinase
LSAVDVDQRAEKPAWLRLTRSRAAIFGLAVYLLVYLSWQLFHWLPGKQQLGQAFLIPADMAALCATLLAARRCKGSHELRSFWWVMSAAIAAETIADIFLLKYNIEYNEPPFPTIADAFFLSFYVLLFAALLRVPVAPVTQAKRLRILLDGAIVVAGGGAVVWYFVLGPTARAGGQDVLATAVSLAYPLGDLILLAGLAAVLLRRSPPSLRVALLLVAAGMLASIVADVVYGYGVLHSTYKSGDPIDTLYVLEFLLFALAGISAQPVASGEQVAVSNWSEPAPRASWLPYLTAPIGFGLLIGVEWNKPFFPELSLVLILTMIGGLVAARQYLSLRELAAAERARRESEHVKDEFISVVGHELRTPLTSIRGSLGLLEGGVCGELPAEAQSMLTLAVTNTDRLVRLINDVLDIERMDAGAMELELAPVKASALVANAIQAVQMNATQAGLTLRADVDEDLTISVDADRIIQVLVNLLGNAIKFSPRRGTIEVTVSSERGCARFAVKDTGRGIPADRLKSIFERFRQVDSSDAREMGGSGLGLAIARDIVSHHGGQMSVESAVGVGSTFYFTLPLARDAGVPPPDSERRAGDERRAGERRIDALLHGPRERDA